MSYVTQRRRLEDLALNEFSEVEVKYYMNGAEQYTDGHWTILISVCLSHILINDTIDYDVNGVDFIVDCLEGEAYLNKHKTGE